MSANRAPAREIREGKLREWMGPLLALAVCFFCFGILLSRLGFFQDDWHHVFIAYSQGAAGLKRFLLIDRGPFAWLVYAAYFRVLGFSPAAWHWSLMLVRCLTVLSFWGVARRIWPQSPALAAWLALIFAVYPIFTLQPLAVAYTLHWSMYLVFMASVLVMLEALRRPRLAVGLTALALLLEILHLAMIEYFAGLELARPVFLWLALAELSGRQRIRQALRRASPYLAVLLLYALYRSSLGLILGFDRFGTLAILGEFFRAPLANLQSVAQLALQDVLQIVFATWQAAFDPAVIELSRPSTYGILGSMVGLGALAYFLLMRAEPQGKMDPEAEAPSNVILAGLLLLLLSMLPFWLTGFSVYQKNQLWSERLALATMPGASMLLVGAVFTLIERPRYRHLVLGVFLSLAVGIHAQTARSFQASWDKQRQLYWQLHWRAPTLKPNTILMADQEILFYMGIYPTAFALNVLYPQAATAPEASYWFNAGFEHVDFEALAAGKTDSFEKYGVTFNFSVDDVVAITFEPGLDQCLWILRPALADARSLTAPAKTWLAVSDESHIVSAPAEPPRLAIFGKEPAPNWCYYFEKADLARQYARWDEVVRLWTEATKADFRAANGVELVPFIEAYARQGDWEQARLLTRQAQVLPDRSIDLLCDVWDALADTTPSSSLPESSLTQVREDLGCVR